MYTPDLPTHYTHTHTHFRATSNVLQSFVDGKQWDVLITKWYLTCNTIRPGSNDYFCGVLVIVSFLHPSVYNKYINLTHTDYINIDVEKKNSITKNYTARNYTR